MNFAFFLVMTQSRAAEKEEADHHLDTQTTLPIQGSLWGKVMLMQYLTCVCVAVCKVT